MNVARGCAFGLLIAMFLWVVIFVVGAVPEATSDEEAAWTISDERRPEAHPVHHRVVLAAKPVGGGR